ncbi:hypothetical protein MCOR27_006970 [Pyricularia oryzae]|uniref:BSD domain-containing protein n=4 Tax=Pyricularia TaxID=48558 RepID=A0ABQ8N8B3_PYRGI|nr:uncharacterized protein MGG_06516 [Pyricularia oryzae 70-15]ELQ44528.1 BSD domain-containing protein [Pyricularia oryzae Y34]KAH8843555.1 hypothetical protein MCOR01_004348 [Pyricularia oryzae]KAI6292907.1 hypothetical protein MCOR33_009518 [Pyricularia grisea]EHA50717.1 hypothetical protein MGG_06516 [Pyricularia oryzae 70-15]KAH9431032.1 hypothetical protein MCOR02_008341 [Pyricularia oryzae]
MDLAYDHITEETLKNEAKQAANDKGKQPEDPNTLTADVQDAYRAFSASPWGARIGGFIGAVAKQGGSVYNQASHELSAVGQDATTGFSSLRDTIINRTRSLSLATATPENTATEAGASGTTRELTTDEALKESETVLSRLKVAAAQRLKDIQKAEDAADEALLKFGTNIRDFLRESISIAPPTASESNSRGTGAVLFESKDAQGKRVIHTSRFDAQLHVIHTNPESFSKDPAGEEYASWSEKFDIDKKTEDISSDLKRYPELRTTMEKLVPDEIPYPDFWKRYYFLRHSIETAEARRRDLLKAASTEEEVGWDEDSDDEETPAVQTKSTAADATKTERPGSTSSSTTINVPPHPTQPATKSKTPGDRRKSNELDVKSQADSEASYDVVGAASGVPSQAPNSPKDPKKADESDEEDWE